MKMEKRKIKKKLSEKSPDCIETKSATGPCSASFFFFFFRLKHVSFISLFQFFFKLNLIFFISWRLIILQYCSGFCHTLKWISHGFTCVPHPDPPSHLPLHPIPLGPPSAPGLSTCLMHPTWTGDLFHPR